jgi:hypothetical protein
MAPERGFRDRGTLVGESLHQRSYRFTDNSNHTLPLAAGDRVNIGKSGNFSRFRRCFHGLDDPASPGSLEYHHGRFARRQHVVKRYEMTMSRGDVVTLSPPYSRTREQIVTH